MAWIQEIERIFEKYFKDVFDKLGFERYQEMDGPGMGALIKFKNDKFRVQLINDRGLIDTELSPLNGDEQFRAIELFYSLINLSESPAKGGLERRRILGKRLDFTEQVNFILEKYARLKSLLDQNNYKETITQVDTLGGERFNLKN